MNKQCLLKMDNITKRFPGVVALNDVKLELYEGEILALLGENGAGKSTLIKVLTGVETLDEGNVTLLGESIKPKTPLQAQQKGISTVYQEVNLCYNLSVAENIYIGREPRVKGVINWKEINKRSKALLERFELDIDVTQKLDTYSVAIQQMVAIARAVDISAKVLILDEPTSSLSTVEVEKLFDIMRKLKQQGMGIIFVTHFLDQVYSVCDSIQVLRNGSYVGRWSVEQLPKIELVGQMIGKEYSELNEIHKVEEKEGDKKILLKLEDGATGKIKNVELEIKTGEVVGFSGLLGSGRSETARLLFGADQIQKGRYSFNSNEINIKSPLDAIRAGLSFCPENRKAEGIVADLSVRDNIILALQAKRGLFKAVKPSEADSISKHFIEKLQIKTPSAEQKIKNLSGGNQQKVMLARCLATEPKLLMLDEPTRGIDIGTKAEIQKIVVELAEGGMSLVFISSELDEMLRCCSRMVILRDKKKVAELEGAEINESTIMKYIAEGKNI